ncbi:MAG: TIGR00282 family metallophosphoesterase [Eubacteriales bacterium]|jgi:metallophosphoesterase (TIGR00282 family)
MAKKPYKILAIGDVVGPAAAEALCRRLQSLRGELGALLVVVNGENACAGNGLDPATARMLFGAGTDVITSGNHIWHKRDIKQFLEDCPTLIRPVNYPSLCPGHGSVIVERGGKRVLVINALGTVYMEALDSPFDAVDRVLEREEGKYDYAVLDIHAEATSEKLAIANYFDGRINVIFGTHTHVQTADEQILPGGSGYITDLGMTGPTSSVLGIRTDIIIERFRTRMPVRFEIADGPAELQGALFTLGPCTGRTIDVKRIRVLL